LVSAPEHGRRPATPRHRAGPTPQRARRPAGSAPSPHAGFMLARQPRAGHPAPVAGHTRRPPPRAAPRASCRIPPAPRGLADSTDASAVAAPSPICRVKRQPRRDDITAWRSARGPTRVMKRRGRIRLNRRSSAAARASEDIPLPLQSAVGATRSAPVSCHDGTGPRSRQGAIAVDRDQPSGAARRPSSGYSRAQGREDGTSAAARPPTHTTPGTPAGPIGAPPRHTAPAIPHTAERPNPHRVTAYAPRNTASAR